MDRQLPFLCVHRRPLGGDTGTERLVKGEASYLIASGDAEHRSGVRFLVGEVARTLSEVFGAFLIVELWSTDHVAGADGSTSKKGTPPTFQIHASQSSGLTRTVETLETQLRKIKINKRGVDVDLKWDEPAHPPDMPNLLSPTQARELKCWTIGLGVPPVYQKAGSAEIFPLLLSSLRRSLGPALRQTFFQFAHSRTVHRPRHYHSLGRRAVVKAVWEVDEQLAAVSNSFDYLLQLTPINGTASFQRFQRNHFQKVPEFHYRPLPVDPALLKRQLHRVPIERLEDPALQSLFREKQEELDLKISMLRDRDTRRFLYQSLQLFGGVEDELLSVAKGLLDAVPSGKAPRRRKEARVKAAEFEKRAQAEFDFYRKTFPGFKGKTQITSQVTGLMVTRGRLLIDRDLRVPESRVNGLLAHEVGTHLLTYFNGRVQPFRQLYSGLAGYEELQEGLAVLSEYLVGELSPGRMRQLAARVVATRHLIDGASFEETYRALCHDHGFSPRGAYTISMRVYRSGGFTKDAVYLRGLQAIWIYLRDGGDLDPLFLGKMALKHIPILEELLYRGVLSPCPARPRYLQHEGASERLAQLTRQDASLLDLVRNSPSERAPS